jgi:hypothetical protein
MDPSLLADFLAAFHLSIVLYMVLGQVLVLAGWIARWEWVRNPWFRLSHLGIMVYIAQNAIQGELCFLTHMEADLRREAGQTPDQVSFIGKVLRDLLYVDVEPALLNGIYLAFFGVVLISLVGVRPRLRQRSCDRATPQRGVERPTASSRE